MKVAKILYDAKKIIENDKEFTYGQELDISSKKNDLNATEQFDVQGYVLEKILSN